MVERAIFSATGIWLATRCSASTPVSPRTVVSGILAYNKGLTARSGQQGFNTIEPEAVLAHEFTKRVAGFLDWDGYQDFNADQFGQTRLA